MARLKEYLMELEEMELNIMMYLNKIDELFNPKELDSKIITVGELNNILGNNIALLKIIDVRTSYNYSEARLKEMKPTKDSIFRGLESDNDIYIKVLTTKNTYYLKVREELDYYNPVPTTIELLEKLITNDKRKGFKHTLKNPNQIEYEYLRQGVRTGNIYNRFRELIGIEFLVTGLGIELDPRANILDNLIILDGVPSDYRKIDLE